MQGKSKEIKVIKWVVVSLVAYLIISGIIVGVFEYAKRQVLPAYF